MILLFLQDLRSVIVVVVTIPLALLGALLGLWLTNNTVNIMSLGGLALSIGILVDTSTVVIENVHVQMEQTRNVAIAVLQASRETAVPIMLALLCVLSVFVPAFIMADPLRSLFMPLTLAVGFAMIASFFLSTTFVPGLCVYLLKHHETDRNKQTFFNRTREGFAKLVTYLVRLRCWWSVYMPAFRCWSCWSSACNLARNFSRNSIGTIRAAVSTSARIELQIDGRDGIEVPG